MKAEYFRPHYHQTYCIDAEQVKRGNKYVIQE